MTDPQRRPGEEVGRETALLWLHDRIGREVAVSVVYEIGDAAESVLDVHGELQHHAFSQRPDLAADERDEWMGDYRVGDTFLSTPEQAGFWLDSDELRIVLADDEAAFVPYAVYLWVKTTEEIT